ncbi:MAG: hypothetical protein J6C97_00960, partial [Clostridia bacterium]|nr:hypothetical protein [Clostridia bacterium]
SSASGITYEEIECSGFYVGEGSGMSDNVLANKTFVPTEDALASVLTATWWKGSGYEGLTDGITNADNAPGRFSTVMNASGMMDATIDLGGIYKLYDLKFYLYDKDSNDVSATVGNDLLIQVYYNGAWKDVVTCPTNADIVKNLVAKDGNYNDYLIFNLGGERAEKIRIYISSASSASGITYEEIECKGLFVGEGTKLAENVLLGKAFTPTADALASMLTATWWKGGGYETLTDGITNADNAQGRFSTIMETSGMIDATLELDGIYELYDLTFYLYDKNSNVVSNTVGTDLLIQVYYNGSWKDVVNCATNADIVKHLVTVSGDYNDYLAFNLNGEKAEKIRLYISASVTASGTTLEEIACSGVKIGNGTPANVDGNILTSGVGVNTNGTVSSQNPIANLFDGKEDTYAEVTGNNGSYFINIDFGYPRSIYSLSIVELISSTNLVNGSLATASDDTTIQVYVDGYWLTVASGFSLSADGETTVNLYGIECSQIKIIFNNTRLFDGQSNKVCAKICEIKCSAFAMVDRTNLLKALNKITYSSMDNYSYAYTETYKTYAPYASNINATQEEIDALTEKVNKFLANA